MRDNRFCTLYSKRAVIDHSCQESVCRDVPEEMCELVDVTQCQEVPRQFCQDISFEECRQSPKEVCWDVPGKFLMYSTLSTLVHCTIH